MTPLIFGKTGQVACELRRVFSGIADATFLGREDAELTDPQACADQIERSVCDVIINAAAYTAVDGAETDEAKASIINGAAPAAMARAAAQKGVPFLHISTDYVFDGAGSSAFMTDHLTAPLNAYGRTKLIGERGIIASQCAYAILRTSWVFSAHGNNFAKTMLRLGTERDALNVVADQVGGPTPAAAIAEAIAIMAAKMCAGQRGGVFHFAGAPDVSWADFARTIMSEAGLDCAVNDISTQAYPTPAKRPGNSRLDCSAIEREFGICRPDWKAHLRLIIEELRDDAA